MIMLNKDNRTIEFSMENEIMQTEDRRKWSILAPKIICASRTDAENMQKKINTFIFNLAHETLELDKKRTLHELNLSENTIEPKELKRSKT